MLRFLSYHACVHHLFCPVMPHISPVPNTRAAPRLPPHSPFSFPAPSPDSPSHPPPRRSSGSSRFTPPVSPYRLLASPTHSTRPASKRPRSPSALFPVSHKRQRPSIHPTITTRAAHVQAGARTPARNHYHLNIRVRPVAKRREQRSAEPHITSYQIT